MTLQLRPTFSESWYRVQSLRMKLRAGAQISRQYYRGERWYVVRDPARVPSSWRSQRSLDSALREQGVVGISGIDTRALTRHLRDRGAMRVGISTTT